MKMYRKHLTVFVFQIVFSIIIFPSFIHSASIIADYPDTLYIPVTFYDFHSDSSCPEFEITPIGTPIEPNMVADTLDKERKPLVGSNPYFNRRIDRWFRQWVPGDSIIYNYAAEYPARYLRYTNAGYSAGVITLAHDTSFKNIVIQDTLAFHLINATTGTYEYTDDTFFPLDGKGFGNEGRTHNYSFAMELHWEFTKVPGLQFEFVGDDDVWAFVDGKLRMDLGGIHVAQDGSFNLDQAADLEDYKLYTFDFFYVERHVTQSSIKITTNIMSPNIAMDLGVYPNDTICPFTQVELRSIVTDDISGARPDLSKNTTWRVLDYNGQPERVLQQTSGTSVSFVPEVAYSRVLIEGAVFDGKDTLRDSLYLYIEPCEPCCIHIEANPVNTADTAALRFPQEIDTIRILANQTTNQAYAIARDLSGAYVRLADSVTTQWTITPDGTLLASVSAENNKKYLGVITRIGVEGKTNVVATEPTLTPDTAAISIVPYYIVRLQLRDSLGNVVDTIKIETDSAKTYFVYGLKSNTVDKPEDPASWVLTPVSWNLTPESLILENPLKNNVESQTIRPKVPGTGVLNLSKPEDNRTQPLDIPVVFIRSKASDVKIKLITEAPRRAGDTLLLEVRIYNQDGLIPGEYCFGLNGDYPDNAVYSDRLGLGEPKRPYPTIKVDGVDTLLNILDQSVFSIGQCFTNGIDTVKAVLFYAPFNITDNLHQIKVSYGTDSNLTDKTEPFVLLPNTLDSIAIEDKNYIVLPPQILTGSQSVTPYSDGYDRFGNRIGFIISKWSTTGTLDRIDDSATFTYISAETVPTDQEGDVCAEQKNDEGQIVKACLHVVIIGPKKMVSAAVTRDLNGNGFLDAIEFTIDRAISANELSILNFTDIKFGTTRFTPDSISFLDSNRFYLHFSEQDNDSTIAQTGWKLYYSIQNATTIANTVQALTGDGAGPVIWLAIRNFQNGKNEVKVYLSERVKNINNSLMNTNDNPSLTFNVYLKNDDNTFTSVSILDNAVTNFTSVTDSILIFDLPKEVDLTTHHYMNLEYRDTIPSVVQDNSQNLPHPDNIKRKIKVVGQEQEMIMAPNPTRPSFEITGPGVLELQHVYSAIDIAAQRKGVILRVTFTKDSLMSATLTIHDMVGNLVNYRHIPDYFQYLKDTKSLKEQENSTMLTLDLYWNGSNAKGMPVSPGVYRITFAINYKNSPLEDVRFVKVLGMAR